MRLEQIVERGLDLIYPPICVACHGYGAWWCRACRRRIERIRKTVAPPRNVDALVVTGYYHDPRLRAVIHALKYSGLTQLRGTIGEYIRDFFTRERVLPWRQEVAIQTIPAARTRVRTRGFDQTDILADALIATNAVGSMRLDLLTRTGGNMAQAMLASQELRAANTKGIFCIKAHQQIPREALLVDDVVTSGATMQDAARALRAIGVERVYGFALAIGK